MTCANSWRAPPHPPSFPRLFRLTPALLPLVLARRKPIAITPSAIEPVASIAPVAVAPAVVGPVVGPVLCPLVRSLSLWESDGGTEGADTWGRECRARGQAPEWLRGEAAAGHGRGLVDWVVCSRENPDGLKESVRKRDQI